MYRYEMHLCEESGEKLGFCEVCGKYASEVFYQIEERQYKLPERIAKERGTEYGWTRHECKSLFGHKDCLEGARNH